MTTSTFVGRETEVNNLTNIMERAGRGDGRIVFVEGEAGSGKSFLVKGLQTKLEQQKEFAKTRFIFGQCYEDSGSQNAYQPFVEILGTLIGKDHSKDSFTKLFLSILKETGGDWLAMIPGIGPAITAGLKTVTILAGQWLPHEESKTGRQTISLANQYVQTITKIAEKYAPLVLVIEDAHWIDESSCLLLQRIEKKIGELPLVVMVTYRPSYLGEGHPFWKSRNEILSRTQGEVISLGGLSKAEADEYLQRRFGNPPHPKLAEWLTHLCKGNPLFLTQYLSLLEQDNVIRLADKRFVLDGELKQLSGRWELSGAISRSVAPNSIEALLEQRIRRLVEEDQEMLQLGAVQGEQFMSSILADLLDKKESDVLRRLRKVMEQHRLISLYTGTDLDRTRTEIYTFEHALLQQTLYNKLSPRERVLYHQETAEQLAKTIGEDRTPPRKLLIDTANHFDLGQVPDQAAEFYYLASQSLLADGARTEAAELARRALTNINQVPESNALRARIIVQYLSASHARMHATTEESPFFKLIEEAKLAATRVGDPGLMAQIKFQEAMLQYGLHSLTEGIATYREALELIRQVNEPIGEYIITSQFGHHLCGVNLREGLDLQYQAQEFFQKKVNTSFDQIPSNLRKYYYAAQCRIGVNEFDLGNYGLAAEQLRECVREFRNAHSPDDLVWSLNFLAQVYIAMGAFEEAEAAITEALAVDRASEEMSNCYAYNLTLLGKLYVEWNRVPDAEEPMHIGFQESLKTQIKWEMPLARNYYAELVMMPDYSGHDLKEAARQLDINIEETQGSKFFRSLVSALSLRAITALTQGQINTAVEYSTQAVSYIEDMGDLPALRTEEVLFNHYQILKAADKLQQAIGYLKKAHETLLKKSTTISNPDFKKSFLARVNLSRKIGEAIQSERPAGQDIPG